MKTGAFKPLPGQRHAQAFPGTVVDLSEARRILTPDEARRRPAGTIIGAPQPTLAHGELREVCIRPKETTIGLGRWGTFKLWPVQFVGQARVWPKPDGGVDLQGVGQLRRQRPPRRWRVAWYLVGAPIYHVRRIWLQIRGRFMVQGAIVTKG